ncbi:MAG: magnesium transporter, partial [Rhodospirillales bacterium]|nr:magnesium transporter [Rhodospirillales bacterium]
MSQVPPEPDIMDEPHGGTAQADDGYVLTEEFVYEVENALEAEDAGRVTELVEPLHVADLADLLEYLTRDERHRTVEILGAGLEPEVLAYLDPAVREEVIEELGPRGLARALSALDSDDAVEIFEDLDEEFQSRILATLPKAYRTLLEESLSYPEDSAGRLMQRETIAVPSAWTVGKTIDYMRESEDLPDDFYDLFIVNPKHRPIGAIPLSRVLRSRRPVRLTEIMDTDLH